MSEKFKAIVLNQSGDQFTREIKNLDKSFFKTGDVLVKVDYSGLNYKDALILNNGAKLVKEYPHIPGIDFSGQVADSESKDISYECGEAHLFFKVDGRELISRMIDAQFPAFERVIPKGNDKKIEFDEKNFLISFSLPISLRISLRRFLEANFELKSN